MTKRMLLKLRKKIKKLSRLIKENKLLSLLSILFLIGIVIGNFCTKFSNEEFLDKIDILFSSNFKLRAESSMTDTFIASFSSYFLFMVILVLMGLSAWGIIFIPLVPIFKGLGLGLISGFLYSNYGFKGILFYILVILPGAFISSIGILLESKDSINISLKLISSIRNVHKIRYKSRNLKTYFLKICYIFVILAVASFFDTILSKIFSELFKF